MPRIAIAMATVALLSVGIATVIVDRGMTGRLEDFAQERLATSARHAARLAAEFHRRDRLWTPAASAELQHVAEAGEFRLELRNQNGRPAAGTPGVRPGPHVVAAPVMVRGRRVGTVLVAPKEGLLLPRDRKLQERLDRLHLVSAALALAIGLVVAAILAASLARPLRRLTGHARGIELGQLGERLEIRGGGGEIRQLAEALDRLSTTLRREDELRRETLADVAHELRTPVSGILARIEAVQDGVFEGQGRNLEAMHAEARRLAKLIADLEQLVDAERPGLTLQKRRLDLAELTRRRAGAFALRFSAHEIDLEQHLQPAPVFGEPTRLEQVVDNLLSNALLYTDSGGRVRLTVRPSGDRAMLEVADTGIGISAESLTHVFDRFWRADRSRSRATGGAGIGLAIVSELVRAHDGRVTVESELGAGSTFRIELPLAADLPTELKPEPQASARH